jgi:DNA-binding response OmpR family regulator
VTRPAERPLLRPPVPAPGAVPPLSPPRPLVRALLAEDERIVGDLLAEFLVLEGYAVDRAMNGREALELVRRESYAVIVSDVRMPDVDGPAFYYELLSARPALTRRMVFVTGDIVSPDTRRFLDQTSLRYLEKPFTIREFQAALRGVLDEASAS